MSMKEQVLFAALRLQPNDRADLAAALLASLDETEDAGASAAWDAEAARRAEEVDSGKVQALPEQEFWRRVRDEQGCRGA
jgi:putative addiction module component (TIGR02574 family)